MTIENLKQIAIKYATTKGSRVPLAPDELCNAVVQYFNEFLKITADINTIQVAVTEEGGNIVFTITGNTLDGKAFTPIVITVDHNDFVTNQEFEEFKTSVTKQLNNKRSVISSPASSYVVYTQANGLESNLPYSELANQTSTNIMARRANGTSDVKKGISGENVANMENIADVEAKIPDVSGLATKDELSDKVDKVTGNTTYSQTYAKNASGEQIMINVDMGTSANTIIVRDGDGRAAGGKAPDGSNTYFANMENIQDVLNKIPDVSKFATKDEIPEYTSVDRVIYDATNGAIIAYDGAHEIHIPLQAGENVTINASEDNKKIVISAAGGGGAGDVTAAGNNTFTGENTFTNEITFNTMKSEAGGIQFGNFEGITENGYNYSNLNDYQFVMQKFVGTDDYYETVITADLITYKPAGNNNIYEFHFPNKSGIFALTSDVPNSETLPKLGADNTFTGDNNFKGTLSITKDLIVETARISNRGYTWSFPLKAGTVALTTDIPSNTFYFISFYANEPIEPCHLIGTMMSKNSYGTGQKTNEEFAVMLADNFYTNSNEGLAAYGKLADKDILCIYSEDGLSIRCLDEENSEVVLPTVMFFVMETEL